MPVDDWVVPQEAKAPAPPSGGGADDWVVPGGGAPSSTQPPSTFLGKVAHAGAEALSQAGFSPPTHIMTAQEYPREEKGFVPNVVHAAKLAFGETFPSLGLILGPGEAALNIGARAIAPLATEAEQATVNIENQARDAISRAFAQGTKSGGPTASDAMTEFHRARAEGQPLNLSDVQTAPLQALADTTYRQGGTAAQILKGSLTARQQASSARTAEIIGRHLSDESFKGTAEQLAASRSEKAKPLWDEVRKSGPIYSDRLQELINQPEVQRGIRHGYAMERRRAIGAGEEFRPNDFAVVDFDEAGDPVFGKVPTMAQMMVAKEGLDSIIEAPGMKDPLTGRPTKDGLSYIKLRDGLVAELDRLSPLYRQARQMWSGDTASIRALNDGRDFLSSKVSPEELAERVGAMSENDRQFYIVGVADALKNKLFRTADAGNKGAVINTEDARMRLRPLFGSDEAAQNFIDAIERERTMNQTGGRIYGGSPTAPRLANDANDQTYIHAAHGVMRLLEGRFFSAAAHALRVYRMYGGKPNPALSEAVARALVDPNISLHDVGQLLAPAPVPLTKPPIAPPALLYGRVPWQPEPAASAMTGSMLP